MRLAVRRFVSIAKATTLEIINEPLSLLLLSASLVLAVFAPAFHYHQFGEATRMARDAGLSALLIGGILFSVTGATRSMRRELESGTAAVALSHPVSRAQFFLAKVCGAYAAFALFALAVGGITATMVNGARLGAELAAKCGDIPKLWGPSYALGVTALVLPYIIGAVLNRVWRFRFPLTAFVLTIAISMASVAYRPDLSELLRLLPAEALLWMPPAFFVTAAAAASVRLRANAATAVSALLVFGFLPFAGNYSLSEALSKGGHIPTGYVVSAALAALPGVLAAAVAGLALMRSRDV